MDASSLASLQNLVSISRRSLLQYVNDACPFATAATNEIRTRVLSAAAEEREVIARLARILQKHHVRPFVGGSYPAHFTQYNFINVEHLAPMLLAENQQQLVAIEPAVNATDDPDARPLLQSFLDMKRRHFQVFTDAVAPQPV